MILEFEPKMRKSLLQFSLYYILLPILLMSYEASCATSPSNSSNDFKSISDCIKELLDTEKFSQTSIMILSNDEDRSNIMIERFVRDMPVVSAKEMIFDQNYEIYKGNVLTVVIFENCEEVIRNKFALKTNVRYLILINEYVDTCDDVFKSIGSAYDEYDVDFIIKKDEKYKFVTFVPEIDETTCMFKNELEPTYINECHNGTLHHKNIFPIKGTSDMKECPLKIGIATLFPFAMIENKTAYKDYDRIFEAEGSDVAIMSIISKYLNAKPEYHSIIRSEENPWSDTEFLKLLLNGSLEALAGGLYRIYGDIVAYSGIYQRQGVVWVYTADRENRSWRNFVRHVNGLYIFLLFHTLYCFVWSVCSLFDKENFSLKTTILQAWGALIGGASLEDARTLKKRTLNIFYLILCIHLSFYINVQLFSFLTIQRPPEIFRTNEEIIKSGRTPYLKFTTKYFTQDPHYVRFANTSKDCDSFEDCEEKTLAHKGLTVVLDGLFYPFQFATAVGDEARILRVPENLLTVYHEMIIRKESLIVKNFQKVMSRLFEAGICNKLYMEAIGISVVDRANKASENMMHNSYSCETGCSITLAQAAGIFYVWLIGCILSCFVLVAEILVKKLRK